MSAAARLATLVLLATVATASPARAQAPPDTSLGRFLGDLADSTDQYFGITAADVDTTELDSVLSDSIDEEKALRLSVLPSFGFNRADGPTYGLIVGVRAPRSRPRALSWGSIGGRIAWAAGPNDVLGGGEYQNRVFVAGAPYDLRVFGGRATSRINRESSERTLNAIRALVTGGDRSHYYRHDGWQASVERDAGAWRAGIGWRDMLESPLPVTATWNLLDRELAVPTNLPAAFGRVHELELTTDERWASLPVRTDVRWAIADDALGSDFDYRRLRAAAGAELPLGRWAALVPQVVYGRLDGDSIPQAAFYLGGGPTLKSVRRDARGGTRLAIAKLDLIGTGDLLALAHLPHSDALPIQGGLFVATGAVWGPDPYGLDSSPEEEWPEDPAWSSEVGVSLFYSSGLFSEGGFARFSATWPVGGRSGPARFTLTFTRALDLLRKVGS